MNALKNRVQLIGHLGQDPEVKQTNGGTLTRFSIATTDRYKNKQGEQMEDTQWHNVVVWGKLADIAGQYLRKGQQVALEGKLNHRSYDDKDGNKRYYTQVVANDFLFLDKKGGAEQFATQEKAPANNLPF